MTTLLQNAGALISFVLGFIAVFWPARTEAFTSVQGVGKEGNSEVRATYGGFFIGISLFAMLTQNPLIFVVLGVGWLSAALARLFSFCFGLYTHKNLMGVVFEGLIGALCSASVLL